MILGVPFDPVTRAGAIRRMEQMIAAGRPHYVVTPNVDFLVQARKDRELHRILLEAHLALCDGTPILWASRILGTPLPERVAGSDVIPELIRVAEEKGYRVFLLGATPEAAAKAAQNLARRHPGLLIAGHYSPPFRRLHEMNHGEIRRRIRQAAPDVLLVAFGCPKQEKWMALNYRSLGVPVSIGCGATIDFLGGCRKRAPSWMRQRGLEWVYRLAQEPRRLFNRYAGDAVQFGWMLAASAWRMRCCRANRSAAQTAAWAGDSAAWHWLRLPDPLDRAGARASRRIAGQVLANRRNCLLQAAGISGVDGAGVGFLVHLQRGVRENGCRLVLLAPSPAVQHALKSMRLQEYFAFAPDAPGAAANSASNGSQDNDATAGRPLSPAEISLQCESEFPA